MIVPPAKQLKNKDAEMLEEMQNYCMGQSECRRKQFHDKFCDSSGGGSSSGGRQRFVDCGNMCDNCLVNRWVLRNEMTTS